MRKVPIHADGETIAKVVEYLHYHSRHPPDPIEKPLTRPLKELICEWDSRFLYTDLVKNGDEWQHDLLIRVMKLANYLCISSLKDLVCACCASMMDGKDAATLRKLFHLPDDLTEEQRQQVAREVVWVGGIRVD